MIEITFPFLTYFGYWLNWCWNKVYFIVDADATADLTFDVIHLIINAPTLL